MFAYNTMREAIGNKNLCIFVYKTMRDATRNMFVNLLIRA